MARSKKKSVSTIMLVLLLSGVLLPLLGLIVEPAKAEGTVEVDISPKGCYVRAGYEWINWYPTYNSFHTPPPGSASGPWQPDMPLVFDLESHGYEPGDTLTITYNFSLVINYQIWNYSGRPSSEWQLAPHTGPALAHDIRLYGVFSSDGFVDPDFTKLNRVPGAIDAGKDGYTNKVLDIVGNFGYWLDPTGEAKPIAYDRDTDIPEDFEITPYYGFEIEIPRGAKYIIVGVASSTVSHYYGGGPFKVVFDKDSDGDGLLDSWEQDGIDVDGDEEVDLDLPLMGADWEHKDLFVEVDYMASIANCSGHRPDALAIEDVKQAFRNAPASNPDGVNGVNLHVDLEGAEALDHVDVLEGEAGWTGFNRLKRDHFGTVEDRKDANKANILEAKKRVYHYCLFVHERQNRDGGGVGELPGNDFMVSLGSFPTKTGTRDQQAAVFMHELGHNLGLQHGGGDDINYKPNYLSVMNYLFVYNGDPVHGRPLDYSRRQLSTLNENKLDELFGIGGLPGDKTAFSLSNLNFYGVKCFVADGVWIGGYDGSAGLDWNGNGTIDGNGTVWSNINNFPEWKYLSVEGQNLTGYNDWANLNFNFRSTAGYADSVNPHHTEDELTPDVILLMREAVERTPVIPEFASWILLPTLMVLTLTGTLLLRKRKTQLSGALS